MVVSQANPVDPASDIEKPNTDWNKVEISFKKKDFQVTTKIWFMRVLIIIQEEINKKFKFN